MTIPLDQFVCRLADSGLMTVADVQAFVESLPVDEQPQDAEQALRALVQGKRLTNWQARQIGAGDGQSLVLGNYVILDKLGQGGMGEVFKAQHQRMQRMVALKLLSPQITGNPEGLKRFQREVVAAARLLHPNVVAAYDADEAKGTHFLVMEHVPGRDLGRLVRETGVLSVAQALRCIVQAARGLEYAHSQGVVHRDVKPSNLLLDATGVVKVLDLGLARIESAAGQPHDITSTGDILGTVDFMAPEQAENTKSADARSDVYSLGMTLWFLLTGRPGYERDSLASKIMAHRTAPIPPLREARTEVSEELEAVFQKLVAKDPRERYQTMTEVIAALEGCIVEAASTVQTSSDDNELAVRLSSISRREIEEETLVFITPAGESTLRLGASAPTLPMQAAPTRSERSRTPLAFALAFLGGAAVILLTVFLLGPPRGDNVLVEVTDPEVAVTIDNGAVKIVGAASKKLRLREGEHELAVKRGETELAETFTVAKGKSTTLEIEVVDGVLRVKQDGQVLGQIALAKPPGAAPVLPAGKFVLEFAPGSKVEIGSLKLDRNGELTLEAYVTPQEAADGKPGVLLGTPQQFALHLDPTTNRLSLESQHDDGAHQVGPQEIVPGRRTHVAAVRAANEHRLYVDGVCVGREKLDSPLTETAESFTMGGQFAGAIEELRISSTARYDEAFAPTERLEPDGETLALYHVSDGGGDTLVDSSGHDHSGKIVGAKWISTVEAFGKPIALTTPHDAVDYALSFDGESSYVEIPTLELGESHPLTLETWVTCRRRELGVVNAIAVYGKVRDINIHTGSGNWGSTLLLSSEANGRGAREAVQSGKKMHLASVWDGESHRFYVDGKLATLTHGGQYPSLDRGAFIGGMPDLANNTKRSSFFFGEIDEARLSKVVRYDQEFAPSSRFVPDADTLALYHFDEGSGEVLKDSSGNNHHGKIVGAKWVEVDRPPTVEKSKFALRFDSTSMVALPKDRISEIMAGLEELTVEAVVTCEGERTTFSIFQTSDQFAMVYDTYKHPGGGWGFYSFGNFEVAARAPWEPGRKVHLAGVQSKTKARLYLDGRELSSADITERKSVKGNGDAIISPPNIEGLRGSIEQFRISSTARYDQDFTPVYRFPRDSQTVALYQFDEGQGDVLGDSSGNGHHGKIVGAKWVRSEPPPVLAKVSVNLLQNLDPAKDGLVHDPSDNTWKPGKWQATPEGLRSGSARREIYRLPVNSLPPSYSLLVDFELAEGDGALLGAFSVGTSQCYLVVNGSIKDGQRQAGFGEVDGKWDNQNETTVLHPPCKLGERHVLKVDVLTSGDNAELLAELDGKRLTSFRGKAAQLGIGASQVYDSRLPKLGVGSMIAPCLFHRVELTDLSRLAGRVEAGIPPPAAVAPFDAPQAKAHQEAWAKHLGVPVEYTNSIDMKFRLIPPGEFIMGSTPEEIEEALPVSGSPGYWNVRTRSEGPQHRVILTRPVFVGVHEVTQRQYETVMKRNPSHFAATGAGRDLVAELDTHDHPVESASWNDAAEFCIRLSGREQLKPCYSRTASHVTNLSGDGYRLPTEAQWEFAVRAGTTSKFWSGDRAEALPQIAWNGSTSGGRPHAVGELRANPFGLFDVYGNVAEWVQDRWHAGHFEGLAHATTVDPEGSAAGDPYRALRGGDWLMSALYCRSATRNSWVLSDSTKYFGFRVALSVEAVRTAHRQAD